MIRHFRSSAVAVLLGMLMYASGALAQATVPTSDIKSGEDHPLAKRYQGSFIVSYERFDFIDFRVPLSPIKRVADEAARDRWNNRFYRPEKEVEVEGTLTRLAYVLPAGRSPLEVLRNYQDVIAAAGGTMLFECRRETCGGDETRASGGGGGDMSIMQYSFYDSDLKDPAFSNGHCALSSTINDQRYFSAKVPVSGGDAYVIVHTYQLINDLYCKALSGRTIAAVQVLEPKQRDQRMVLVEAAEMKNTISAAGSIALYGIFFDTDKADIKPESDPTLAEIAKLIAADPSLSVVLVGHTDNQGAFDYNTTLSSRRAVAVKNVLVSKYKINAARLTSAGAGMMAPIASNDSEDGRAKNRRVVLVKR